MGSLLVVDVLPSVFGQQVPSVGTTNIQLLLLGPLLMVSNDDLHVDRMVIFLVKASIHFHYIVQRHIEQSKR